MFDANGNYIPPPPPPPPVYEPPKYVPYEPPKQDCWTGMPTASSPVGSLDWHQYCGGGSSLRG